MHMYQLDNQLCSMRNCNVNNDLFISILFLIMRFHKRAKLVNVKLQKIIIR